MFGRDSWEGKTISYFQYTYITRSKAGCDMTQVDFRTKPKLGQYSLLREMGKTIREPKR